MKDIFAELYKKVVSFFNKTDEESKENAKDVACNRLKLVLMQDRTNLTPAIMDRMRKELIELLSKYMELDRDLLDLNFEQEDNQMALMLSIPVIRAKNEDEIQEILDKEDEEKRRLEELNSEAESDEDDEEEDSEDDEEETESDEDDDAEEEDNEDTEEEDDDEEEDEDDDVDDIDEAILSDVEEDEEDENLDENKKKEDFFSKKKIK